MAEWESVRLPKELFDEVTNAIKKKGLWVNEHDFIREAVREKVNISKGA